MGSDDFDPVQQTGGVPTPGDVEREQLRKKVAGLTATVMEMRAVECPNCAEWRRVNKGLVVENAAMRDAAGRGPRYVDPAELRLKGMDGLAKEEEERGAGYWRAGFERQPVGERAPGEAAAWAEVDRLTEPRPKIESVDDIPDFASEAEAAEFWSTHELGGALLEQMRPRPERELPPARPRTDERTPPTIVAASTEPGQALAAFVGQELEAWGFVVTMPEGWPAAEALPMPTVIVKAGESRFLVAVIEA